METNIETNTPTRTDAESNTVYASTFIFAKKQYDDEFHRLDAIIAQAAKSTPGYLGEETWENAATGLVSNVYYWSSLAALRALMDDPVHRQAKAAHANWLSGYRVVISQVMRTYGDGKLGEGVVMFEDARAGAARGPAITGG